MQYFKSVSLDLNGRTSNKIIQVKQYDDKGRVLSIELLHNGADALIPAGAIVTFRVVRPDGFCVCVSTEGDYVTQMSNVISVTLTAAMLSAAGNAVCDILVTKSGENLSSGTFTMQVNPAAYRDDQVRADASCAVLVELLDRAEAVMNAPTFTPQVSAAGVLSWTNDKGLQNPEAVDIAGLVVNTIDSALTSIIGTGVIS